MRYTIHLSFHHIFYDSTDLLCRIKNVLAIKVSVARRRLWVGMAEQTADHWQRLLTHRGVAGERVPQQWA
ncbi:hypothetical protein SAMN02927924_03012 [Sphingobium faniae]|nr:hypothetical protein SAMN02927924_03012 [Sphingobium faniae]